MNREQNRLHAVGMNRMNVKNHNDSCNSSKVKQEAEKCGRHGARERERNADAFIICVFL